MRGCRSWNACARGLPGCLRRTWSARWIVSRPHGGLGTGTLDVSTVPASRLAAFTHGMTAHAPALRQMAVTRRTATLLATVRHLETQAADEVLDVFDLLYATKIDAKAERASVKERLAALPRLLRVPPLDWLPACGYFSACRLRPT